MFSPVVSHWVNAGPDNSPRLLLFSSSARRRLFNSLWTLDEAAVSTRRSKPPLPRGQDGGLHGRNTAAGPSTALQPARFPQVRSLALHRRNLAGLAVRDPVRTASPFHNADDSTPAGNPRRTPRPLEQTVPCHREATTSRSQYSMSATGLCIHVCQGAMQPRQFRRRERHQLGARRQRQRQQQPPAEFGVLVGAEDIEPAPPSQKRHSGPAWVAGHRTGDCPPVCLERIGCFIQLPCWPDLAGQPAVRPSMRAELGVV